MQQSGTHVCGQVHLVVGVAILNYGKSAITLQCAQRAAHGVVHEKETCLDLSGPVPWLSNRKNASGVRTGADFIAPSTASLRSTCVSAGQSEERGSGEKRLVEVRYHDLRVEWVRSRPITVLHCQEVKQHERERHPFNNNINGPWPDLA